MKLSNYEIEVLSIMLKNEFNAEEIDVICKSDIEEYEFTGVGYFAHIRNSLLPHKRTVISSPVIIGEFREYHVGFVLFMENNTLTIECHTWGRGDIKETIRQENLRIKIT